jgi:hypothetical protein
MGRAVIKVADALVGYALKHGIRRVVPAESYPDVRVVDTRFHDYCVELLVEAPTLGGLDSAGFNVPTLNVVMQAPPVLEGDALLQVIADHQRNSEAFCDCSKLGLASSYTCPRCRSLDALQRIPSALLDQATAMRRAGGETIGAAHEVPDDTPEATGEVPGA